MINFLSALNTAYNESGITAELYPYPAPQYSALPYITWEIISVSPTLMTFGSMPEAITVRFSVWSESDTPSECVSLRDSLRQWLDDIYLTITGEYLLMANLENENMIPDPDGGYTYHIDYIFTTEKGE